MKKTIVLGTILFSLMYTSVLADGGIKISEKVKIAFRKEFVNAQEVQWENFEGSVRAIFTIDNRVWTAYFHSNGHLIAVTRNISSSELPIQLLIALKKDYPDFWITDLFEMYYNGETSYFISLNSSDLKLELKSGSNESWESIEIDKL
jgi:hypothetical protein